MSQLLWMEHGNGGDTTKKSGLCLSSIHTGEVLDYVVKSLVCYECRAHLHDDTNSETYQAWKENHQDICTINHKGSSESMEKAGAVEIFLRSIETRHLVYNTFVGDGDTGSFASV